MMLIEKKILEWVQKHMVWILVVFITLLGIVTRYTLRDFESADYKCFLKPWYDILVNTGGIRGLSRQVGEYNMLYQFIIAIMTYLPIQPLYAYKIVSAIFDFVLAGVVGKFVYDISVKDKMMMAMFAYAGIVMSPIVFLNSSAWAQCDVLYVTFVMMALGYVCKEKYIESFVMLGIAFAFKLQAIFILPFFLMLYFVKKKFSILYFAIIPAVNIVAAFPCLMMGRKVTEIYDIYFKQTGIYKDMVCNYPSFWSLLTNKESNVIEGNYMTLHKAAIVMTIAILAVLMGYWIMKKVEFTTENIIYIAFLTVYTCVLFLPGMHERYGFLCEVLAIIIVFFDKKTIPLWLILWGLTLRTYGQYMFSAHGIIGILSTINVVIYLIYIYRFNYKINSKYSSSVSMTNPTD